MKTIDCRGMKCPKPVIMTKKEIESMDDTILEVIVDNDAAKENVSKYAKSIGLDSSIEEKDGFFYVKINKEASSCCKEINFNKNQPVIIITSDKFGTGDDKLGSALMKSYLYALGESDVKPKSLLFLNGGVKLTTEGSDVIESLKSLEGAGVEIMSCGTCLDFYNLKDKLVVGTVTNMYTIVEKMNGASNTIKI